MPYLWATQEPEIPDEAMQAEAARVQAELAAIEAVGDEKACRICGGPDLTEEHTPSRKAGNPSRIVQGSIDYDESVRRGALTWEMELIQGGAKSRALCETCNNRTGRWYNPAYIRLVKHCEPFATLANVGAVCDIQVAIHPQRVAKQALTTLLATSQPGVAARFPHIRRLLLDAEERGSLAPLRLGLFVRANGGGRPTAITLKLNLERRAARLIAEFSFWPLGWLLTFDDQPVEGTLDVSGWTEYGYHEKVDLQAQVPCQWAFWVYPAQFGPAPSILQEEYAAARRRAGGASLWARLPG